MQVKIEGEEWIGDVYEVGLNKQFPKLSDAINFSNTKEQAAVYLIYDDQYLNELQQEAKYPCYFVGMNEIIIKIDKRKFQFYTDKLYLENVTIDGIVFRTNNYDLQPLIKANKSVVGINDNSIFFDEVPKSIIFFTNVSCLNYNEKLACNGSVISKPDIYLDKVSYAGDWLIKNESGMYGLDDKQPVELEYSIIPEIPGIMIVDDFDVVKWFESKMNLSYQASTKILKNDDVGFTIDLSAGGEIKYVVPDEFGGNEKKYITFNVDLNELPTNDILDEFLIIKDYNDPNEYGASFGVTSKLISVEENKKNDEKIRFKTKIIDFFNKIFKVKR